MRSKAGATGPRSTAGRAPVARSRDCLREAHAARSATARRDGICHPPRRRSVAAQRCRRHRAMGLMALLCPEAGHLPEASARRRSGDERPVGTNAAIRTEP